MYLPALGLVIQSKSNAHVALPRATATLKSCPKRHDMVQAHRSPATLTQAAQLPKTCRLLTNYSGAKARCSFCRRGGTRGGTSFFLARKSGCPTLKKTFPELPGDRFMHPESFPPEMIFSLISPQYKEENEDCFVAIPAELLLAMTPIFRFYKDRNNESLPPKQRLKTHNTLYQTGVAPPAKRFQPLRHPPPWSTATGRRQVRRSGEPGRPAAWPGTGRAP